MYPLHSALDATKVVMVPILVIVLLSNVQNVHLAGLEMMLDLTMFANVKSVLWADMELLQGTHRRSSATNVLVVHIVLRRVLFLHRSAHFAGLVNIMRALLRQVKAIACYAQEAVLALQRD